MRYSGSSRSTVRRAPYTTRPRRKTPFLSFTIADRTRPERGRRVLNIAVALVALLVSLPVMLVIAVLVKLTSRGPIFYTQPRVGLDRRHRNPHITHELRRVDHGGKLFRIYKFRTMTCGERAGAEVWAAPDDPRVTPVGRILRKFRLDELPQFINVLRGEMNIVGPRPEQPAIFAQLREQIDGYPRRQHVLPGITGLAQINQHYDRCIEDVENKLRYDLEYVQHRSWREDLRIMLRTIPVVIFRKGAW